MFPIFLYMTHSTFSVCPIYGSGLGLKREFITPLQQAYGSSALQHLDFVEIAPENWIGCGGRTKAQLAWVAERLPIVCHGLSLSLGGLDPLNMDFLRQVKQFLRDYQIPLYTEHLSYCSDIKNGQRGYLYDLLPIPFTQEAVRHVAARIRQTQDVLERRIAVENASFYVMAPIAQMSEVEFIQAVLTEADCDLHLDVNNVYVNSINFGFDASEYLRQLKQADLGKRIVYGHIAGHYQQASDLIIDTHGEPIIDPVWQLLDLAYTLFGVFPTLLERDTNLPPFAEALLEVNKIAAFQALNFSREQNAPPKHQMATA